MDCQTTTGLSHHNKSESCNGKVRSETFNNTGKLLW